MSRKRWLSIKRGLIEDPKHRQTMGIRIWLFMHMIDRVNWDTGIVSEWKDRDEASDMEMAWRTLQQQRQELQELGYITCKQKGTEQEIIIHKWTSPRNYDGEILNPRGTVISVPSYEQGTVEGTVEGNRKLSTPTLIQRSKIKETPPPLRAKKTPLNYLP